MDVLAITVLVGALLVYGNAVAYRAVQAPVVVVLNLAIGAALVAGARIAGVSWHALGLDPALLGTGLLWGGVAAAAVAAGVAVIAVTPARGGFEDIRTVRMVPRELAFHYLVRIPFGTALFEEVVFRGAVLALLAAAGLDLGAILLSSLAFGLWHIGASLDLLRANRPRADARAKVAAAVAGVALTAVGGLAFAVLRLAAESLLAPVLAHAALNAAGLAVTRGSGPREPAVP